MNAHGRRSRERERREEENGGEERGREVKVAVMLVVAAVIPVWPT